MRRRHFTFFVLGALTAMATRSKVTFVSCVFSNIIAFSRSIFSSTIVLSNRRSTLVIGREVVVLFRMRNGKTRNRCLRKLEYITRLVFIPPLKFYARRQLSKISCAARSSWNNILKKPRLRGIKTTTTLPQPR